MQSPVAVLFEVVGYSNYSEAQFAVGELGSNSLLLGSTHHQPCDSRRAFASGDRLHQRCGVYAGLLIFRFVRRAGRTEQANADDCGRQQASDACPKKRGVANTAEVETVAPV